MAAAARIARSAVVVGGVALVALVLYALSESRRTHARNTDLRRDRMALRAELETSRERVAFLEEELRSSLERSSEVAELVAEHREWLEGRRARNAEVRARALRPMPEGVRLALLAINERLREDGFAGVRFLEARGIEDRVLREAELLEHDGSRLSTAYYRGDVRFELDRTEGQLVMRLTNGEEVRDGRPRSFPDEGLEIPLAAVDGAEWERRLPFLITAAGAYPESAEDEPEPRLDPLTLEGWRLRIARLLELAATDVRWEVQSFRTLADGAFADVLLLGHDEGRTLSRSAEARRLSVELDREAGIVSLVLRDGLLRRAGGETTIPDSGYRILLPGVTPAQAIDTMLGMVVERK